MPIRARVLWSRHVPRVRPAPVREALVALRELGNDGHMDLVFVTVDCAAPAAVADFWSEALRWRDVRIAHDASGAVCRSPVGGVYLEFIRVPEGKQVKNRLHLGCTAGDDLDRLDDEIGRLAALRATVAWEEEFPTEVAAVYRNVVLRDVEGNEFCVGAGHTPSALVPTPGVAVSLEQRIVAVAIADQVAAVWIPTEKDDPDEGRRRPGGHHRLLRPVRRLRAVVRPDHRAGPDVWTTTPSTNPPARSSRRGVGVILAAAVDNWVGLGLSVLLTIYLVIVLVRPEKF